ncbi:2,3-diketo-5-methylthiopentyl-1-phosphate enolase [Desmospora activa DSM 45169]|uniref:2,3-diketo-5-methylthiopentyl-1-phosphate enolase n=1 Tax=Desmospora activa DSM 45169 TaxID=1121389 RepID=A0A2T4Z1R8_9BACL|nr:2,3-diketo-5-methylthiopentyl-1-phosphate enolase [Desmospora activa DSM 45169]
MATDDGYLVATYEIDGHHDPFKKAKGIAIGLTVGTWTELPQEKQAELAPHLGKVVDITTVSATADQPAKAHIKIGYPVRNLTPDLPAILTTVFGKLSLDDNIRLLDLELPPQWEQHFPGPKLGIAGMRERLGVFDRPLLMSIFKQCIGLPLVDLEKGYRQQLAGGVDLIKDDEIFFQDEKAPVLERVRRFKALNLQREEETGQKAWYAVNVTGPSTTILDQARRVVEAGADVLLLNVYPYGLDILHRLAADDDIPVPVMAHPAFAGAIQGVDSPLLLGKLLRWAGADLVLYPSPYGSVALPRADALAIAAHLRSKSVHRPAFPGPAAGIHPGMVPVLLDDFGHDLLVNAGGGIHGHPQGAAAGGKAFRDAIEATVAGQSLDEAAQESAELQQALDQWGVVQA